MTRIHINLALVCALISRGNISDFLCLEMSMQGILVSPSNWYDVKGPDTPFAANQSNLYTIVQGADFSGDTGFNPPKQSIFVLPDCRAAGTFSIFRRESSGFAFVPGTLPRLAWSLSLKLQCEAAKLSAVEVEQPG
ncbi:hypothetical protein F5Y15DRAFT_210605 [Xylariaceae sp. FL0016]|nr:hypothetical protein F5Y15DRAFT_210605 [Xylariaceae sp. FL0016]